MRPNILGTPNRLGLSARIGVKETTRKRRIGKSAEWGRTTTAADYGCLVEPFLAIPSFFMRERNVLA